MQPKIKAKKEKILKRYGSLQIRKKKYMKKI